MPPEGPPPPDSGQPTTLRPRPSGRSRALLPTVLILGSILVVFVVFTGYYTEWLWFKSVGFNSVFTKQLTTRLLLFGFFGLFMAFSVGFTLWLAYRLRPAFRGMTPEQQNLDRYRVTLEPVRRRIVLAVSVMLGLLAGGAAAGAWRQYLLFATPSPSGSTTRSSAPTSRSTPSDLPFLRYLVGFGFATTFVCLMGAAVVHYLYGGIKLQTPGERFTPAARAHLSVLLGIFVLLKGVATGWTATTWSSTTATCSPAVDYTEIDAVLPAKNILMWIALICAMLFFVNVFRRTWALPVLGLGLLVLSAVVIGGIYPAVVQQFQVRPSETIKESPYIQRNIDATRQAYDLSGIDEQEYAGHVDPDGRGARRRPQRRSRTSGCIDPAVVSSTFKQLQQIRGYYGFPDPPRRRPVRDRRCRARRRGRRARDRLRTGCRRAQQNFANLHTIYTHGYGFVGAYGNTATSTGRPDFFSFDVPTQGELDDRLSLGSTSARTATVYSIVGGPEGVDAAGARLPRRHQRDRAGEQHLRRRGRRARRLGCSTELLFAVQFQESNILLSDRVNSDSKILYDRDPRERVEKVAPWLTVDGDPYPAVVDGRIVWIVDGYTTSERLPLRPAHHARRCHAGRARRRTRGSVTALESGRRSTTSATR